MLSGGLAQFDTALDVEVLEDGEACGAPDPDDIDSDCTQPTSSDGRIEPRTQTLRASKQAGLGFAGLSGGLAYSPIPILMLQVSLRIAVTFPVVTPVLTPELGVAMGF
jgi:hypothetical protein